MAQFAATWADLSTDADHGMLDERLILAELDRQADAVRAEEAQWFVFDGE